MNFDLHLYNQCCFFQKKKKKTIENTIYFELKKKEKRKIQHTFSPFTEHFCKTYKKHFDLYIFNLIPF